MLSNNMRKLMPTVGFILIAVIVSILALNYFNINMLDNEGGLRVLNRSAVYEGLCPNKEGLKEGNLKPKNKDEGFREGAVLDDDLAE